MQHPTMLGVIGQQCCARLYAAYDRFQTLRNNTQQGVQTDATCNIQQC